MCEDHYLPNEFNYIGYEASSGGLSCPDSDARMNWYGMGGIPDLRFDGNWDIQVGAPASDVNGLAYMAIIDSHRAVAAPMAVIVSDFTYVEPGAFAEIKVKMFDDIASPAGHVIRVAIVEDDLIYGGVTYHNTLVDMLVETPLAVSNNGEEQIVNLDIAMGAGWNPEKLQIIAFVQRDSDKYVLQSGNSFVGEYGAAVGVTGPQQVIADGGQVTFGTTNVINVGLNPDVFDVTLDTSSLPNGWDAHMVYDGADYQAFSIPLDAFDSGSFHVVMNTGTVGSGRVVVDIASQGSGGIVESLDFVGLAGGTDLLVVANDDGAGYAYDYYAPAIDPSGKTYAIWDRSLATVTGDDLLAYEAVIWQTGSYNQGMAADDRAALDAYLAAAGKVILSGEDLLESLYNQGGSARLWYQLKLRINYDGGTSSNLEVDGQPGTVGEGLNFALNGGDSDQIVLLNGQEAYVTEAFRFGDGVPAGTQTEYNGYKILTLTWGLERVPSESERVAIIDRALGWMGIGRSDWYVATDGSDSNPGSELEPFATIQHAIDSASAGDTVFVLSGVYTGDGNRDIDPAGKLLTVRSQDDDPLTCTIDCQGSVSDPHRGFWIHTGESSDLVVRGMTITGAGGYEYGGAFLIGDPDQGYPQPSASPQIENCELRGNSAANGAGIAAVGDVQRHALNLYDSKVVDNDGSGIAMIAIATFEIVDCLVDNNDGVGIYLRAEYAGDPLAHITRTVVSGNSGIGFERQSGDAGGVVVLSDCDFIYNGSWGVKYSGTGGADLHVDDIRIHHNAEGGFLFDAYYIRVDTMTVAHNGGPGVFINYCGDANLSYTAAYSNDGLGIYASGNDPAFRFSQLSSINNGGNGIEFGVEDADYASAWIDNCLVAFNDGLGFISPIYNTNVACTDIYGNTVGDWDAHSEFVGLDGNISIDPMLCDPENSDYTLSEYSPCAPGNNGTCDLIGALPVGCTSESFFADVTTPTLADSSGGNGVTLADYDNDGNLDIYLVNYGTSNKLFRNLGNGDFADATTGPLGNTGSGSDAAFADYDNDGSLDLYLSQGWESDLLLHNDGDGTFTDQTTSPFDDQIGGAITWIDFDNDGLLDVLVGNMGEPNVLARNLGAGQFQDVTSGQIANALASNSRGVSWSDYDNDGDLDVYLTNRLDPNLLLRNDGYGIFTDVTPALLADAGPGSGAAWGDYDNDGDMDLYLANNGGEDHLFRNDGAMVFTEIDDPVFDVPFRSVCAAWADIDNDQDLDLYLVCWGEPNLLLLNMGDHFLDVTPTIMSGSEDKVGFAWGDFDNDGDLDIYETVSNQPNHLYENLVGDPNNWLHVRLQGVVSNRQGVGARVRVVTDDVAQIRDAGVGEGLYSHGSLAVEFGLGDCALADSVVIRWPSGIEQIFTSVPSNQVFQVVEPVAATIAPIPAQTGPIACSDESTIQFHYSPAADTPAMRAYSIRLAASDAVSFTASDVTVFSLPPGDNVVYEIIDNGPNDLTIDYSILGGETEGISSESTLFSVTFSGFVDGLGTITLEDGDFRDLANQPFTVGHSATATIIVDCGPPAAVTNLVAVPAHQRIDVTWNDPTDPDLTSMIVYRSMWHDGGGSSAYPTYGLLPGNIVPARPQDLPSAISDPDWSEVAVVEPGTGAYADAAPVRGIYFYEVFAVDQVGNSSLPAEDPCHATSYWLGDIAGGGDGYVAIDDITALGDSYGVHAGHPAYNAEADVGPTDDASGTGLPTPDEYVGFDDLVIFGLNFGTVDPDKLESDPCDDVTIAWFEAADGDWICSLVQPCPSLKAVHVVAELPLGARAEVLRGQATSRLTAPVFLQNADPGRIDVGFAVLGSGQGFTGTGELFRVRLTEPADLGDVVVEVRDLANASLPVIVSNRARGAIPRAFELTQNFPNPFNPKTTVAFGLPRPSYVTLVVFGVDGRRVRTLAQGNYESGLHEMEWDGVDDRGRSVASGAYFYRIETETWSDTRKMVLLK